MGELEGYSPRKSRRREPQTNIHQGVKRTDAGGSHPVTQSPGRTPPKEKIIIFAVEN